MPRLLLIRPGVTEYDQQGRIQGTLDIPLSEDGRVQAESLADTVRQAAVEAVYASPCQSAQQTAKLLAAAADVKLKSVEKLQNLDYGLWQGMLVDDVKTKQPKVYRQWQEQPETVCPPQGETVTIAKQRVTEALKKIVKRHKPESAIAVVAPEPVASLIRHVLLQEDLGDFWNAADGCGSVEVLEVEAAPAGVA
ncbi:MAG: histidine phosphatase family protein [Planctomycetota bacterium]